MKKTRNYKAFRVTLIGGGFALWLSVVCFRAGYLQLYRGEWLSSKAVGQVEEKVTVFGKRGTIYDSQRQAMAVSIETPSVAAYPAVMENKRLHSFFSGSDQH